MSVTELNQQLDGIDENEQFSDLESSDIIICQSRMSLEMILGVTIFGIAIVCALVFVLMIKRFDITYTLSTASISTFFDKKIKNE